MNYIVSFVSYDDFVDPRSCSDVPKFKVKMNGRLNVTIEIG